MTNEPIFLPVAPHSVDSEFLLWIDKYREIVEEGVFPLIEEPIFFGQAVEIRSVRV